MTEPLLSRSSVLISANYFLWITLSVAPLWSHLQSSTNIIFSTGNFFLADCIHQHHRFSLEVSYPFRERNHSLFTHRHTGTHRSVPNELLDVRFPNEQWVVWREPKVPWWRWWWWNPAKTRWHHNRFCSWCTFFAHHCTGTGAAQGEEQKLAPQRCNRFQT